MKIRLIVIISIWYGLSLLSASVPAAGQQFWSTPIELSPLQYGQAPPEQLERRYGWSWLPDMTLGPDGSVHVVWYGGLIVDQQQGGTIDLLMYRRRNADGSWEPVRELIAPGAGGYTVRTAITLGRDGKLHTLYRAGTSIMYVSAPWDTATQPQAWQQGRILSDSGYYVALAADHHNTIHAFWSDIVTDNDNPRCYQCGELFYRRSTDGGATWSPIVNLSETSEGDNRPQVRIDALNRIHVVWDEGADWYAGQGQPHYGVYRRSDDGGVTWNEPVRFRLPPNATQAIRQQLGGRVETTQEAPFEAVQQTALTVDSKGNPFIVYRGVHNDRLYFQRSFDGGNTWTDPVELPYARARDIADNNLDYYSLASDSANNVHLLMVGFTPALASTTTPALIHMTFDGVRWQLPRIVMHNNLYPELPRLTIYNGNQLHAVWFTRSQLFASERSGERAIHQIWYSNARLNLPAQPGLALFTPTPLPATPTPVTVAVFPTATPFPLATESRNAPPLDGPMQWEVRGLAALGGALGITIVGIALIAGLIIGLRRRQQ